MIADQSFFLSRGFWGSGILGFWARVRCTVIADQSFFLGVLMGYCIVFRVDSAMIRGGGVRQYKGKAEAAKTKARRWGSRGTPECRSRWSHCRGQAARAR